MATTAHDVLTRADALLRDTGPLHTAAGLGFVAGAAVVDEVIAALPKTTAELTVVDTRAGDNDAVRKRIVSALSALSTSSHKAVALVVAGGDHRVSLPALLFAQAVADRVPTVDLGDRMPRALPDGLSLVILVDGVDAHVNLPRQLQRVDYWEFIDGGAA